ncbi:MAG: 50S ribosomal protein L4 [bacterium]
MHKAILYTHDGEKTGEIDLPDSIFGVSVKKGALYYALRSYLANARRGTASTKTKAEVAYAGAKPWRQKGTGRARVGSRGSPLWVGGGVAMGPKPRDYSYRVPGKVKRIALRSVLTNLASEGRVTVIEDLRFEKPRTKAVLELLQKLQVPSECKCLILVHERNENARLSVRNLANVQLKVARDINALDVVRSDHLVATKRSVEQLTEVFSE